MQKQVAHKILITLSLLFLMGDGSKQVATGPYTTLFTYHGATAVADVREADFIGTDTLITAIADEIVRVDLSSTAPFITLGGQVGTHGGETRFPIAIRGTQLFMYIVQ
jgi:hypothetical protein